MSAAKSADAMGVEGDPVVLAAAASELRSAYTIVADPQCDDTTAMPHLRRAWQAVAALSIGRAPEEAGTSLRDWLSEEHLVHVPAKAQTAVHGTLATILAFPSDPRPWEEPAPGHAPPKKALWQNMRTLSGLVDVLTLQQQGRPPAVELGLRWSKRVLLWGGAALIFVMLALRPWQSEDIGPWRAAYYPTEKFEGEPDLRREPDVDFDWGKDPPTDSIPSDRWGARFDTCLALDEDTEVAFQVVSDDGSKVYVDGKVIIDNWDKHGPKPKGKKVELKEGMHHLRVDYFEAKHSSMLSLVASFDEEQAPSPIPARMLEFPGMDIPDEGDPCEHLQ